MRFNLKKRLLIEKPDPQNLENPLWIHCASVGEFNTIKPILKELRKRYPIVLTYFSPRAEEFLKGKRDMYDLLFPLPIDLPFIVRKFEDVIKPRAVLIAEREMWVSLVKSTRAKKILLNAYARGGVIERWLVRDYSLIIARTEKDKEIFEREGAKKVLACGNLKFVQERDFKPVKIYVPDGYKIFVAGSTHEGEEELILKGFTQLRERHPIKLILAPRHINRVGRVEDLLMRYGLHYSKRSEGKNNWDVLIVDTLGELKGFYCIADVTFVGGTLVPIGGHNLLEPAFCGKPVLFGSHTEKVRDLEEFLLKKGYGFKVSSPEDIVDTVSRLLEEGFNPEEDLIEYARSVKECYLKAIYSELE